MALKERLEEVDTELGEIGQTIQKALDRTFHEEYTVQDVRITQADHISVLIDLTEPIEEISTGPRGDSLVAPNGYRALTGADELPNHNSDKRQELPCATWTNAFPR